jgi:hypothetical protein
MTRPPGRTGSTSVSARHSNPAVRELRGLRGPGRSRGVDQRHDVVRLHGTPRGVEVEATHARGREIVERQQARPGVTCEHDVADVRGPGLEHARQELLLGDDEAIAGVHEELVDLLGAERVVDRESRCTEVHGGDIGQVELRAIREHERDGVAAPDAERVQSPGEGTDARGKFAVGPLRSFSDGTVRHLPRTFRRGHLERGAQRVFGKRRMARARSVACPMRHGSSLVPPRSTIAVTSCVATAPAGGWLPARWARRRRVRGPPA